MAALHAEVPCYSPGCNYRIGAQVDDWVTIKGLIGRHGQRLATRTTMNEPSADCHSATDASSMVILNLMQTRAQHRPSRLPARSFDNNTGASNVSNAALRSPSVERAKTRQSLVSSSEAMNQISSHAPTRGLPWPVEWWLHEPFAPCGQHAAPRGSGWEGRGPYGLNWSLFGKQITGPVEVPALGTTVGMSPNALPAVSMHVVRGY